MGDLSTMTDMRGVWRGRQVLLTAFGQTTTTGTQHRTALLFNITIKLFARAYIAV